MANVKGLQGVLSELRSFGKDVEKIIDGVTQEIAFQIEEDAKTKAPKNFGKLAQSISNAKVKESQYKVTVNEFYGAYMEFGTGTKVSVPAEFADMAKTFQGKTGKTFEDGLEAIKIWCKAKGIDEKAAYPIFAKILGAGVNSQPFLYPAYVQGKKDYLETLKKELKRIKKKI